MQTDDRMHCNFFQYLVQVHIGYTNEYTLLTEANGADSYPAGADKRVHD